MEKAGELKNYRSGQRGVVSEDELQGIVEENRRDGKKIIWTNGCFDLLHIGHVRYLTAARALGDLLVVGLNSDESVRRLKGENRPINPEEERAEILATLRPVNYVIIFPETSVERYLRMFKPDIFAKGGDYTLERLNQSERRVVEAYRGEIRFIPLENGKSTSNLILKMREAS